MQDRTQVAVIGGGVVGCSVLYHLTKRGWRDVMLLERDVLTSGSTWHAAGGMHTLNSDPNVAKMQKYTIDLYKEIEEISGQSVGLHMTGGVMLAGTPERLDWLKMVQGRGRYLGMESDLITPNEAAELFPLMDPQHFTGALYDENEGHLDPSGTTQAYAKSARINGATIEEQCKVEELVQNQDGSWTVVTNKGTIHAEHVVNAGGLWAREVGRMVGMEIPVLAMEHMYLLTDDMPEVAAINKATGKEVLHAVDFEGELYLRQERGGMLMGTYEKACVPWSELETPWTFGHELLQPDIDRITPSLEVGFEHFPAFADAGIRQIINGPFTFAPDGNPLVGPVRGLKNYWCACGVMAGFSQGGGVGLALSNWIVDGDPGMDAWAMDIARFGDYATMAYTNVKVRENYSSRFSIRFPNEFLPAARPLRTTPVYDLMKANNAVFGDSFGVETPLWFQKPGLEPVEEVTFRRSNAFDVVAGECEAVRTHAGVMEISGFAKYRVTGEGAEDWLNHMLPGRLPKTGKLSLTPMLNERGTLTGDFTVGKLSDGEYMIFGSGIAEEYHCRWFEANLPADGSVQFESRCRELVGLSIAGPKSRDILQKFTRQDLSTDAFPFLSFTRADIEMIPALLGRISFTGELGYEIWVTPDYQRRLLEVLLEADPDIRLFGLHALNSLRLEKSFGGWAREYRPLYTPFEAGLGAFMSFKKNADYIGRAAAQAAKEAGPERCLMAFTIEATTADVIGDEPIFLGDEVVGWMTSGGYAHHAGTSMGLGYVAAEHCDPAREFHVEIIGEKCAARMLAEPLYDPAGEKMRA